MGPNSAGLDEAVSIAREGRAGAGAVLDTRSPVHLPLLIICLKCSVAHVVAGMSQSGRALDGEGHLLAPN